MCCSQRVWHSVWGLLEDRFHSGQNSDSKPRPGEGERVIKAVPTLQSPQWRGVFFQAYLR